MNDFDNKYATIMRRGDYLQVNFFSEGCRFKNSGGCTFCNFPGNYKLGLSEVYSVMTTVLNEHGIEEVLFGVQGSIFDMDEFDNSCLNLILEMAFKAGYKRIGLETHYSFVTSKILEKINRYRNEYSPDTEVYIEMGLETCVKKYINRIGKIMNLQVLKKKIALIQSYNIDTVLNVLWGIPCLSDSEDRTSFVKTIRFVLNTNSFAVIFPYNSINKNEESASLYEMFTLVDENFSDTDLAKIRVAWYGDRQKNGLNLTHKPPKDVTPEIISIIDNYNTIDNKFRRKKLKEILYEIEKIDD